MWRHRASKCRNHNPLGQATVAPSQGKNRKTLGAMVLSCGETVSGKPHGVVIAILSSGDRRELSLEEGSVDGRLRPHDELAPHQLLGVVHLDEEAVERARLPLVAEAADPPRAPAFRPRSP